MRITHGIHSVAAYPSAVTIGNFDGVHLGHQAMLRQLVETAHARRLTPCAITFEPHPREFFSPDNAPARLSNLRDKLDGLRATGIEHVHICRFNHALAHMPAEQFIDQILVRGLGMQHLLIGDDFRFGAKRAGDFALLQHHSAIYGYDLGAMPSITVNGLRVSSTAVRDALANSQLELAQQLLGHPYRISGRVAHGDKLGRELGFPTANLPIRHPKLPLTGIFVVEVHGLGTQALPAVASLGVRPTVKTEAQPILEIHLLNFNDNLYGRIIHVDFLAKLRDEEKYPDLATLIRQIQRDVECAHDYFNHLPVA
ncbi:riboflavin biosynthesis protein RibF [Sulfuriferula sp. AH1]|uniref:bifunctional riboflavin kinase/FAD synthetase n=1 Tax=Sulfuriferula sp. AH1 TaxID=1985873 RepID=UPI000B3B571E|nr:bifunctional riboflavin kinase/FAD synthetase [Sulfuriferula sp. AH1]ARU30831.1 riboflavin biosynthesis protein RibF [Sulfuriferula sp. AH1]